MMMNLQIHENYVTDKFANEVKKCLAGELENSNPFPHFSLQNFFDAEPKFLFNLRNELDQLGWMAKSSDLYDLRQTVELNSVENAQKFPVICAFRNFVKTKVRDWLQKVTGTQLTNNVSLNGSMYGHTDVLLPHDDELEGRAFAFIYYLSPEWKPEYGGRLLLYDTNASCKYECAADSKKNDDNVADHRMPPFRVAKSIVPAENEFLFFRVQADSWHAVEEIFSEKYQRISINGWFYAENTVPQPPLVPDPKAVRHVPENDFSEEEQLYWTNGLYVTLLNILNIRKVFRSESQISLPNFLEKTKYDAILEELNSLDEKFKEVGPLERRKIFRLDDSFVPISSQLSRLLRFMCSESFLALLSVYTDNVFSEKYDSNVFNDQDNDDKGDCEEQQQKFNSNEGSSEDEAPPQKRTKTSGGDDYKNDDSNSALVELEWSISRFSQGCYSVICDQTVDSKNFVGEVMLFFQADEEWPEEYGGFISFQDCSAEGSGEWARIPPSPNSLAIVFRKADMLNFTKYVNSRVGAKKFYIINLSIHQVLDSTKAS